MITAEQITQIILGAMEDDSLPKKVAETLKKFDGKKITKRFETAVKDALPEHFRVHYHKNYSWHDLIVRCGDREWRFNLGYDSSPIFSFENFLANNQWFVRIPFGNAKRQKVLDNPEKIFELSQKMNAFLQAKEEMETLLGDFPEKSSIEKLLDE